MRQIKLVLLIALGSLISACADTNTNARNASSGAIPLLENGNAASADQLGQTPAPIANIRVESITVRVPRELKVSEENLYLPSSDIVWRGDPVGDRYIQIQTIFETAMERGTAPLNGAIPVDLDIVVTRFHALTEKARYVTGGVHNINFILTLRNSDTGALLGAPREVRADLKGFGGSAALKAEAEGQTQKVRISDHLAKVIYLELTTAEGFQNPRLGIIQAMNQI